jgi:hypothetical protein
MLFRRIHSRERVIGTVPESGNSSEVDGVLECKLVDVIPEQEDKMITPTKTRDIIGKILFIFFLLTCFNFIYGEIGIILQILSLIEHQVKYDDNSSLKRTLSYIK